MNKTKIVIKFDSHGLPIAKIKNASREQVVDAHVFLGGISKERKHFVNVQRNSKIKKFFYCLKYALTSSQKPIKRNEKLLPVRRNAI